MYSFLLIAITYICVEMYDKYPLVQSLWKPFRTVLNFQCIKKLNVRNSLITTFATFLLLSYTKICFISQNFLLHTTLTNITGEEVDNVLVIDASIKYLSATHIPYVILAVVMLVVFNFLPLLVFLLYPTRCFQNLLGCFPGVNWHPLHAFMDAFYCCYKNGTNRTRDCRYFAACDLLYHIAVLFPSPGNFNAQIRNILVSLIFSFILATMRPYNKSLYNILALVSYFTWILNSLLVLCKFFDTHVTYHPLYLTIDHVFVC